MSKKYDTSGDGSRLYSISRLAIEFNMARRTVSKRLSSLTPCGQVAGHGAYTLAKAAAYLIDDRRTPDEDDDAIDPEKMLPEDQNQYYSAQLKKLKLMEAEGDLWPTERVATIFGEYNKLLSMTLRAIPERIHKSEPLSPKQKDTLRKEIARLMYQLHEKVIENFGGSAELPDD